jgi:hypothetical protein
MMKRHKLANQNQARKRLWSKSAQALKKAFKHRDRGVYHGRAKGS